MKYTDKQISKLLDGIYDGGITEFDLPVDYYNAVVDYLKKGLYKGFGSDLSNAVGKDLELLTELRENVYMFGAAKTYQEVKEISSFLIDEEGNIRSRSEFNKLGRETYDTWNNDWGKTEYNTAIGQGTMAVKWNEIQANKDVLPTITFSVINPCPECAPFDGFSAHVDDPVWDWLMPLLHFNCMCVVLQQDSDFEVSDKNKYDEITGMKDDVPVLFQNNAGKSGEVFPKDHPYFDAPKELGNVNFNLPIPETDE